MIYIQSHPQQQETQYQEQELQLEQIKNHVAYRNFIASLRSPSTKHSYSMYLSRFLSLPQFKDKSLDEILAADPKVLEATIIEKLIEMKDKDGLSTSTTSLFLAALAHFFSINDVTLNRKKINKFIGEHQNKQEYRSYTVDEISKLLSLQDERGKAVVLLMASTGMRVGALPELKLKHLKRWTIDSQGTNIYQITVYGNSPKSKYATFCTPEAAKAIDEYLEMRKRHGESSLRRDDKTGNWMPTDTFLIIRQFDKAQPTYLQSIHSLKTISSITIAQKIVIAKLQQLGIREKNYSTTGLMTKSQSAKIASLCYLVSLFM